MTDARNITGLSWFIDNHLIDIPEADFLRRCADEGWIYLQVPSPVLPELLRAQDPVRRDQLVDTMLEFAIPMGPLVMDHSVLDFSLLDSGHLQERIGLIHRTLWDVAWSTDVEAADTRGNRRALTRLGDTLVVDCAIHYAHDLVTDDHALHTRATRLASEFPQWRALSIQQANTESIGAIRSARRLAELEPSHPGFRNLPTWPTANECPAVSRVAVHPFRRATGQAGSSHPGNTIAQ